MPSRLFLFIVSTYLSCYCTGGSKNEQEKPGEYSPIYSPKKTNLRGVNFAFGPEQTRMRSQVPQTEAGMGKGVLARLLEALEERHPLGSPPILAAMVAAEREPIEGPWRYPFHMVRYAAADLIKSGIFIGDRLKGKKIPSSPPKFQTYPIIDPEELVFLIAMPLVRDIEKDISRGMRKFAQKEIRRSFSAIVANLSRLSELPETWGIDVREENLKDVDFSQEEVKRYFSIIMMNMNPLPGVIKNWGSPRTKEKIEKIKGSLDSLKEELLANVPDDFFKMEDLIDYLVNVLQRHVPKAPGETIARRVADILKMAEIGDVQYKTIYQRMTRRKQQST